MERIDWFTLKMKLTAGETLAEKAITLDRGKRVVAAVAVASAPGKIVDLRLYENGSIIPLSGKLSVSSLIILKSKFAFSMWHHLL